MVTLALFTDFWTPVWTIKLAKVAGGSASYGIFFGVKYLLSILPTFYKQVFQTEVFCTAFLYLQLVLVNFGIRKLTNKLLLKCR